jgi:signal transduction histidine kinase
MAADSFDYLAIAETIGQDVDWKSSLDALIKVVRASFIFDNMALYITETDSAVTEVIYARAVGRGAQAEADAAWGEVIANQVLASEEMVLQRPENLNPATDRLAQAYLLGLPLKNSTRIVGVLVFIRFGGPDYSDEHVRQATFVATQVAFLLEKRALSKDLRQLEDARRTMQLQQDFIATVSHELRTPLGFIKGYTTTLLRSDTTWDEKTRREFLNIIDEEADHLTELIENVLESARLQSNTLAFQFQPTRLDSIIRDVVMRVQMRNKELKLEVDVPAVIIQADNVRLSQVFENLINNAVKYAPGSKIVVRAKGRVNTVHATVEDFGPGISPEHLENLFERFYRVPGQSTGGTGLGLFICSQIVQAHQGKIWVESVVGKGTTFHLELPVRLNAQSESGG